MSAMCDNQNFESSNNMNQITENDIKHLLGYFSKNTYSANYEDSEANSILQRCINLMKIDYSLSIVDNNNGYLCCQYPSQLAILEYENANSQNVNVDNSGQSSQRTTSTIYENIDDVDKIREFMYRARFARCRTRFPVPTILYKGKYICRSSTLSGGPEIYGRHGLQYLISTTTGTTTNEVPEETMDTNTETETETVTSSTQSEWQLFDKVRSQDIKLLKKLHIGTIVDLMVENKKVKYGMKVTSSEKVDKENRYSDFNLISLPYPGCEFFKDFHDNNYCAEGLVFDWNPEQCDATISVPDNPNLIHLKIEWENYKQWDLVTMTQNYVKYLLKYFQDNSSGILIHCISGWDRTPLFISLIRLNLWADGLVHQSLDEYQILYLIIAYDWMLFGHHLSDRLDKEEEIFFFCFYVLKFLTTDEFSIAPGRQKIKKHSEKVVEDIANRTDNDGQPELLLEHDLRGSNISLNSICSNVSSKSQEPVICCHHSDESNGNLAGASSLDVPDTVTSGSPASPQGRRTSPVAVPVGNRAKRTESSTLTCSVHCNVLSTHSSNGTGSWQVVTGTGSLKSCDSNGSGDHPLSQSALSTVMDEEWQHENSVSGPCRKERLTNVRNLFYKCYYNSVGSRIRYGPEPSLGAAILGNIAERVGLTQRQSDLIE